MRLLDRLDEDARTRRRNDRDLLTEGRCVLYWMQRAQRARENPALEQAIAAANALELPLAVLFQLVPGYPGATERHYAFLLEGLAETARGVEARGAAFCLRIGTDKDPAEGVAAFARQVGAALVIGDENPLREPERWRRSLADRLTIPLLTVDADVVVPSAFFERAEYGARTLRPKIHRYLDLFLAPVGAVRLRARWSGETRPRGEQIRVEAFLERLRPDRSSRRLDSARGGSEAGMAELEDFIARRLAHYHERNRHPEYGGGTSRLSAYLHLGQIGVVEVARRIRQAPVPEPAREAFLEQLIVRRELAVNFVRSEPAYDNWAGLPDWGRRTLEAHRRDPRPFVYTQDELQQAATHDPLWNAGMLEMKHTGFMHGYVRMYWAKKILHWSEHPEEALATTIELNDRWLLDGRDPNGYTNIAWAIGGRHDRPWPEREVFGKVRSMSLESTGRKFDLQTYRDRVAAAIAGGGPLAP